MASGVLALVLVVFPVMVFVWEFRDSGRLVPVQGSIAHVSYETVRVPGELIGDMGYLRVHYRYRYSLAGREYDRVVHRNTLDASLRPGSTVTVWVDPLDPARGVLERGPRWWLLLVSAVTAALLVAAWAAQRGAATE